MLRDPFEPGHLKPQAWRATRPAQFDGGESPRGSRACAAPYRIEQKVLVKRKEFDRWLPGSHVVNTGDCLKALKLHSRALPSYRVNAETRS